MLTFGLTPLVYTPPPLEGCPFLALRVPNGTNSFSYNVICQVRTPRVRESGLAWESGDPGTNTVAAKSQ